MKNFLLFVFIIFAGQAAFAQTVPDKANTIVITLPDSNGVNEKVVKVFTSKDFTVKGSKTSPKISTGPKTLKGNTRVALVAEIKGADVMLSGNIVVAAQGGMRVEYKGNKGTPIMNAWEEMDKVAKAFGGKIKYEVK